MHIFKSLEAVSQSDLPPNILDPVRRAMATLIEISTYPGKTYSPEDDGHVALIEPSGHRCGPAGRLRLPPQGRPP